jgi:hypothetical protein
MLSFVTRLILIFVFRFSFLSFGQEEMKAPIFDQVKFIFEESFEADFNGITYSKIGKNRQISWMNDNKMEFDKSGHLIKRTFYDDARNYMHSEEYVFKDSLLQSKSHLSFIFNYLYDSTGKIIAELVATNSDFLATKLKRRFAYDEKNQLMEIWEFDIDGGHVSHQINEYNTQGFLSKEIVEYQDGSEYIQYTYDTLNQLLKKDWHDAQVGLIERTTYSYLNGKLLAEFWEGINKNVVETSTKYEFDEYGNTVSVLEIDPKRQIHDHEINTYVFDNEQNWIRKTTSINNTHFYIVERRIVYY